MSVVIPTLNEAANLPHVFALLPDGLHEVVVVDGRSTDDTVAVARALRRDVVVVQQTRKGKGNALACGFEAVTGDIVVMLDADGSADPGEIAAYVEALVGGADFAKGTRFGPGGGSADLTRLRRLGNRALSATLNRLHGTSYTDLCYGYNAFWVHCLDVLELASGPRGEQMRWGDGFEIETVITARVAKAGLDVREVTSFEHHRRHGVSNLNAVTDGLRVLRAICHERLRGGPATGQQRRPGRAAVEARPQPRPPEASADLLAPFRAVPASRPAVEAEDGTLTYGELRLAAETVALLVQPGLVQQGLVETGLVGVCLPRSAALVTAVVGVVTGGAAWVALDPAHPPTRLRSLVDGAGLTQVLTTPEIALALGDPAPQLVPGVGVLARLRPAVPAEVEPGLAYVMFTSGSTGEPKGVMVERVGLVALTAWHRHAFGVTPADRCSQIAGPGFDAAAWEVWGALTSGATLVVPPEDLKTDPAGLRDWLVQQRITVSFLPTPLAEAVLDLPWPDETVLRELLTGGDRLRRRPPPGLPFRLHNNYGVTEATVVTTSGVVEPGGTSAPSIGSAVDGARVRVLDGELLVSGPLVARGYLHRPDLTAERFVEVDGERCYRTGDLVEQQSDGCLAYVGRADDQVQVRGTRVEPGEVESVLERHPGVRQAVVVVEGGAAPRLVAHVVGAPVDLQEHVTALLPRALHPSEIVWLDALPLTLSGKVDRRALVSPEPAASSTAAADGLEGDICVLVAELLGRPAVQPDEDFLLLGGHSLLGAQVVTRLAATYGVEVSLRAFFDAPTPAGMAAEVRSLLVAQVTALDDETAYGLLDTESA